MLVDKYSVTGEKKGQVELNDSVFAGDVNDTLVYEYMKAANANLRQGTHKTKERAEVRGGGAKPFRQKGTGRARAGTTRSPIWKGGGTVFGPRPRSYNITLNKKSKQAALRSIFSIKAKENKIKVVEDFNVDSGKTKEMNEILKKLSFVKGAFVSDNENISLKRSVRNIKDVKYNNVKRISGRDVFYAKEVLLTESAVSYLNDKYSKGKK